MFTSLDLANHFGFKILNGDLKALHREITVQELDRPGLQLLGMFSFHQDDCLLFFYFMNLIQALILVYWHLYYILKLFHY